MGAGRQPTWAVLKAHFCASPRKTALLSVLFVGMVVVYVRMFASGPGQTADAERVPSPLVPSITTSPTVRAKPQRVPSKRIELTTPLAHDLTRDPFVPVGMERVDGMSVGGSRAQNPASDRQAGELELQSTICCDQPMAVINGRFLQPGDEIGGFILEQVEPTRVWLKRNSVRRELKLRLWAETSGPAYERP